MAKVMKEDLARVRSHLPRVDLWTEVRRNGFAYVLDLPDGSSTLDSVIQQKLIHARHLELGSPLNDEEMLSILLYSGADCYADLRASERAGRTPQY